MDEEKDTQQMRRAAMEALGYDQLRPGQEEAIRAILNGHDTLVVLPTGSGKSAIYQIAGVLLRGLTVVVSPLIALQRDQVESLSEQEAGGAALVNSTLGVGERRETLDDMRGDDLEFLFLAPEQFTNEEMLARLRAAGPSLFVVDEAHCVSEWGHDFRPDYLRLGKVIQMLGHPRVLALTATAAPPVRSEVLERLGMHNPQVVVRGFDRPNIWFGVEFFHSEAAKADALVERLAEVEKPGIIYAATRRRAEELAERLRKQGLKAAFYHGGMRPEKRERAQQSFMDDELDVIVATTAFGMGIDKPNVRFVFHYDISESLDAYYQEIGRSGRDGRLAKAILFYRPEDLGIRRFFAGSGQVKLDQIAKVVQALKVHGGRADPQDLLEETGLSKTKLSAVINRLMEARTADILPSGEVYLVKEQSDLEAIAEQAAQSQERYRKFRQSRIEMIRGYAEARDCRREYLLNYFGEEYDDPCNYCDNCEAGRVVIEEERHEPFPVNSQVCHKDWGAGLVMRYEGDKIVVLFNEVGYKTLALELVTERGLLKPLDSGAGDT